ncbi:MAG: GNAT family N-acetyltransferase, partial [Anaerolineales bacterium]
MGQVTIRRATAADKPEWLRMRLALWPHGTVDEFSAEMDAMLADPLSPVFLAVRPDAGTSAPLSADASTALGGFLEAGTRKYAEGGESSPVGYIEGWYVDADLRGQGFGKALMQAAEDWARSLGLTEMGSDTWLDNEASIQAHIRLGYQETERLV